jgi:hypothetical protein
VSIVSVDIAYERQVERQETLEGLGDNDVDNLPTSGTFTITSADASTGTVQAELDRTGVTYEVTSYDEFGLPETYKATLAYRGIESFKDFGYYAIDAQYTSTEQDGEEGLYVVVATYEPVDLVIAAPAGAWQAGTGTSVAEQSTDAADAQDNGLGQLGVIPPATVPSDPPAADDTAGADSVALPDDGVALADGSGFLASVPLLALIGGCIVLVLVLIVLLAVLLRRRRRASRT